MKRKRALFSLLLRWTGGRISEVLAPPDSFQMEHDLVALRTLKPRQHLRLVPT